MMLLRGILAYRVYIYILYKCMYVLIRLVEKTTTTTSSSSSSSTTHKQYNNIFQITYSLISVSVSKFGLHE